MRSNYKKLGPYIQVVNDRNNDLKVEKLLGVSIQKIFMPSIANVVGTDMSTYKIISRSQFAYGPVTSRNGDKISVALLDEFDEAIVSQAYTVFEVIDENELLPEYLMMWFRRTEFDRYARFKSHGSAREIFDWDEMCETELPIPSIEKQHEIVAEYNTVVNRIKLNEQLNQKLEETAQALYKHWFVDFEFPDENGKPYKSSGGIMVWNEELNKEIPEGWKVDSLDQYSLVKAGGDKPQDYSPIKTREYRIPIFSNSTDDEGLYGYTHTPKVSEKSITVSARGAIIGYTVLRSEPFVPIIRLIVITPYQEFMLNYLFQTIKGFRYAESGSAQGQLTSPEISRISVIIPVEKIVSNYQRLSSELIKKTIMNKESNRILGNFKSIILAKLIKVEFQMA